jgi:2-keto-4-pentenoate hydratase/2-oxohepta-3-ene-1,7-dioic acid hydratase in catechol pathway
MLTGISSAHAAEANMALPTAPILFIKPRTALSGPGELLVSKAAQNHQLDFETELAVVIGKDCRDASQDNALDYVLGYA